MKKIILSMSCMVLSIQAGSTPYVFQSGGTIKALEMNANFDYLDDKISSLSTSNGYNTIKFIGVSEDIHDGDDGVMNMNSSCNKSYPGSRMCTSKEILDSYSISNSIKQYAWIKPVLVPVSMSSQFSGDHFFMSDISGKTSSSEYGMSCRGWSNRAKYYGLSVGVPDGNITLINCKELQPVACCK